MGLIIDHDCSSACATCVHFFAPRWTPCGLYVHVWRMDAIFQRRGAIIDTREAVYIYMRVIIEERLRRRRYNWRFSLYIHECYIHIWYRGIEDSCASAMATRDGQEAIELRISGSAGKKLTTYYIDLYDVNCRLNEIRMYRWYVCTWACDLSRRELFTAIDSFFIGLRWSRLVYCNYDTRDNDGW